MSKVEMLRQLAEGNTEMQLAALSEVMETIGSIHSMKVKNAEELAQSLEPLMSVMLRIASDTAKCLDSLAISSLSTQKQQEELVKTWNYYLGV